MTRALPILALCLAALATACAHSTERPPRWTDQGTWGYSLRAAAAGEVAREVDAKRTQAGGSLTVGGERYFSIHPRINQLFYGEMMGVELRGRLLRAAGSTDGDARALTGQVGMAFTSSIAPGGPNAFRRLRVAALFPVLLPEVGATFRAGARPAPTLRWSAPISYLLHENVAVDLVPAATLVRPSPRERPDLWLGLGVGLSFRQLREPYFLGGDPGFYAWDTSIPVCRPRPTWQYGTPGRLMDLSAALPYRRYLAVTRVTPVAHYFRAGGDDGFEVVLRVLRRDTGDFDIELESDVVSLSLEDTPTAQPPHDLAEAARDYFTKKCGAARLHLTYAGTHRSVLLEELVVAPPQRRDQGFLVGWRSTHVVAMDAALEHVLYTSDPSGERARLELPEGARFLPSSGSPAWKVESPSELPGSLYPEISETARRFDHGLPTTPLAELVPPEQAGIPRSLDPHVRLTVTVDIPIPGAPTSRNQDIEVPLALHDAVFGPEATGEGSASFGSGRFQLRAVLSPSTPRTPVAGLSRERYQGSLVITVEHEQGGRFEQRYAVDGELDVEGDGVMALKGLAIVAPAAGEATHRGTVTLGEGGRSANLVMHAKLPQIESE